MAAPINLENRKKEYLNLQAHFEQHKQLLSTYKSIYAHHRELTKNFFDTHAAMLINDPTKALQLKEVVNTQIKLLQEHEENIKKHEELISKGLKIE